MRGDRGEDQALKLGGVQRLDLPLDRVADVEPVAVGESGPARVAGLPRGRRQVVLADLVEGEQYW
ncbi:hypothetical protein [Streptomyces lavendulae]|uniref:hypothetical protein n=1 Tax=Streptomyces lavendulae TaxID=1914 RepID=UPI0033C069D8